MVLVCVCEYNPMFPPGSPSALGRPFSGDTVVPLHIRDKHCTFQWPSDSSGEQARSQVTINLSPAGTLD